MNALVDVDNEIDWDGDVPSGGGGDKHDFYDVVIGSANNGGGSGNNTPVANDIGNKANAGPIVNLAVTDVALLLTHLRQFFGQVGWNIP